MPQQQLQQQQQQTESSVQCDRAITVSVQPARAPTCVVFQETKRPSKEMQVTIARQLGLDPSTVSNFFMNARRRSVDKWREDSPHSSPSHSSSTSLSTTSASVPHTRMVLVTSAGGGPATVVQHIASTGGDDDELSPTSLNQGTNSNLDL